MKTSHLLLFLIFTLNATMGKAQLRAIAYVDHVKPDGSDSLGGITLSITGPGSPYSYTWNPGNIHTKDYLNIPRNQYTLILKGTSIAPVTYVYSLGYKTIWGSFNGTNQQQDTLKNTNVYSTGTAISKNTLVPNEDGWLEVILTSGITKQQIGFLDSAFALSNTCNDIDYGIIISATGIQKIEGGIYSPSSPIVSYNPGDVFKLERIGPDINYVLNGNIIWTSNDVNTDEKDWKIRVAEEKNSVPFVNVGCSFNRLGNSTFGNYIKITPIIKHNSGKGYTDGSISVSANNQVPATYLWLPGTLPSPIISSKTNGVYSVKTSDNFNHTNTYPFNIGYKVFWTNFKGAREQNDSLINTGLYSWGSGISKNTLNANKNGWLEVVLKAGTYEQIGFLDSAYSTNDQLDMDMGFYKFPNSLQRITYGSYYSLCDWREGDVIRIERIGSTVNYRLNGAIIWTTTDATFASRKLKIKGASYISGAPITNVGCSFIKPIDATINKEHVEESHPINGSAQIFVSGGTPPYKVFWKDSLISGFRSDLSPGTYKVMLSDSASTDTTSRIIAIGIRPNWIYNTNLYFTPDTATRFRTDSLGLSIAENVINKNKRGWIETKVNSLNEEMMIGFVGDDNDIKTQNSTYINAFKSNNTGLLYTLLKNAIDNMLSYPNRTLNLSAAYQKVHAVRLKNGILTPLMIGCSDSRRFPYNVGDIIKVGRDDLGRIYVSINDEIVYTHTFVTNSQYLYPQLTLSSSYYKRGYGLVNPEIDNPPITPVTTYAIPRMKVDGGFYTAVSGKVYFAVEGEYNTSNLYYKVFDKTNNVVLSNASNNIINNPVRNIGDNRYNINVSSLPNGMYILELTNEKNEKVYLRFKQYVNVGNGAGGGFGNY